MTVSPWCAGRCERPSVAGPPASLSETRSGAADGGPRGSHGGPLPGAGRAHHGPHASPLLGHRRGGAGPAGRLLHRQHG